MESLQRKNRQLTLRLLGFACGAFLFVFALVPLYDVLCDIIGVGNQKNLLQRSSAPLTALQSAISNDSRRVTVEFIAVLPDIGIWEFHPLVKSLEVQTGRLYEANFIAHNLSGRPQIAQAIPNIAPSKATAYFRKIECFCFTPQRFSINENKNMLVRFVIDSALPKYIDRITLSYSFYDNSMRTAALN